MLAYLLLHKPTASTLELAPDLAAMTIAAMALTKQPYRNLTLRSRRFWRSCR
ncbi:MAG: hypothetical protein KME45_23510 [Stenomitos rutilans HA7619-LM2]|nr:hypothetical protein [Stenomitos rutilans HA7619-LM2]